mmetsp:Transcript_76286/g.220353  ORF Transcript_76286/g.220353 Transcript_76286/m.220353 type:complete len:312 (-) Transcript_76286:16-951(-)
MTAAPLQPTEALAASRRDTAEERPPSNALLLSHHLSSTPVCSRNCCCKACEPHSASLPDSDWIAAAIAGAAATQERSSLASMSRANPSKRRAIPHSWFRNSSRNICLNCSKRKSMASSVAGTPLSSGLNFGRVGATSLSCPLLRVASQQPLEAAHEEETGAGGHNGAERGGRCGDFIRVGCSSSASEPTSLAPAALTATTTPGVARCIPAQLPGRYRRNVLSKGAHAFSKSTNNSSQARSSSSHLPAPSRPLPCGGGAAEPAEGWESQSLASSRSIVSVATPRPSEMRRSALDVVCIRRAGAIAAPSRGRQ